MAGQTSIPLSIACVCLPTRIFHMLKFRLLQLDSNSERAVQSALDSMLARGKGSGEARTSLVIAHRLAAVMDADCIYVMDKGAVVESGTHDQLMAISGGLYRSLAMAQGVHGDSVAASSPSK